jgi:archaellum component FlaC
MTIDERLDRLTQRHEALTQSVEVLARDMQRLRHFSKDLADGTARLLHIAQLREQRMKRLQGGAGQ